MASLKDELVRYLGTRKRVRPGEISKACYVSLTTTHQALKELVKEGKVIKSGKVPRVYYHLVRCRQPS